MDVEHAQAFILAYSEIPWRAQLLAGSFAGVGHPTVSRVGSSCVVHFLMSRYGEISPASAEIKAIVSIPTYFALHCMVQSHMHSYQGGAEEDYASALRSGLACGTTNTQHSLRAPCAATPLSVQHHC